MSSNQVSDSAVDWLSKSCSRLRSLVKKIGFDRKYDHYWSHCVTTICSLENKTFWFQNPITLCFHRKSDLDFRCRTTLLTFPGPWKMWRLRPWSQTALGKLSKPEKTFSQSKCSYMLGLNELVLFSPNFTCPCVVTPIVILIFTMSTKSISLKSCALVTDTGVEAVSR